MCEKDSMFPQFINISNHLHLMQNSKGGRAGKLVVSMETHDLVTSLKEKSELHAVLIYYAVNTRK